MHKFLYVPGSAENREAEYRKRKNCVSHRMQMGSWLFASLPGLGSILRTREANLGNRGQEGCFLLRIHRIVCVPSVPEFPVPVLPSTSAWVIENTATESPEKPRQIRQTVLAITAKVIERRRGHVAKDQGASIITIISTGKQ
jgi:hypothetical protein